MSLAAGVGEGQVGPGLGDRPGDPVMRARDERPANSCPRTQLPHGTGSLGGEGGTSHPRLPLLGDGQRKGGAAQPRVLQVDTGTAHPGLTGLCQTPG